MRTIRAKRCNQGFALIVAIALMSFLLLLLVGMATLTQLELSSATQSRLMVEARANALLGMEIAIGQLQKHAGPDQRVTASASVYYGDPSGAEPDSDVWSDYKTRLRSKMKDAVDAHRSNYHYAKPTYMTEEEREDFIENLNGDWNSNDMFQPRWIGVLDSSMKYDGVNANSTTDKGYFLRNGTANNQKPVWLVSGFDENNRSAVTPLSLDDSEDTVAIVNIGSTLDPGTEGYAADGLKGIVRVPKVALFNNADKSERGSYAYYVSDESQKVNVTIRDKFAAAKPGDEEYLRRLISPQRSGLEGMSLFEGEYRNESTQWKIHDANFDNILTPAGVTVLTGNPSDALRTQYHSLTADSISIFTDTANGGLKKDLTYYFQTGSGLSDSAPIADPERYTNDPRIGQRAGGFPDSTRGIPEWGQLKEWVENVSKSDQDAVAVTADVRPMLMQFRLFYGYSRDGNDVKMHILPALVMWNQFDAPLESTTYRVRVKTRYVMDNVRIATRLNLKSGATAPYSPDDFIRLDPNPNDNSDGVEVFIPDTSKYSTDMPSKGSVIDVGKTPIREGYYIRKLGNSLPGSNQFKEEYTPVTGVFISDHDNDPLTPDVFQYKAVSGVPIYTYTPFPLDSLDEPVALEFEFTAAFEAGEHLVFTPVTDQQLDVSKNPIRIELENDFLSTGPDGDVTLDLFTMEGPAADLNDDMKIHQTIAGTTDSVLKKPTRSEFSFSISLGNNTEIMSESEYGSVNLGEIASNFAVHGSPRFKSSEKAHDPEMSNNLTEIVVSYPYYWRWLYHDRVAGSSIDASGKNYEDQLFSTSQPGAKQTPTVGSNATNLEDPTELNSPISLAAVFKMEPIAQDSATQNGRYAAQSDYYRAFANYNLSAKRLQINPDIEFSRGLNSTNNDDGFPRPTIFKTESIDPGGYGPGSTYNSAAPWDDEFVDYSSGQARGYSLIENQFLPGGTYKPHTLMPIRGVNRNPEDVLSIAQLSQANIAPYFWQPSFVIGNSEATPYVSRNAITGIHRTVWDDKLEWVPDVLNGGSTGKKYIKTDREVEMSPNSLVDLSYLMNDALWDSYFLSSIPQHGDISGELAGNAALPNSAYRFRRDLDTSVSDVRDLKTAARYLYNHGGFNVNSDSVDAWRALLTSFRDLSLEGRMAYNLGSTKNPDSTVPIVHSTRPLTGPVVFDPEGADANTFGAVGIERDYVRVLSGFRYLSDSMIDALAKRIVDEVRFRGPFMSLSDFVNRRLVKPDGFGETGSAYMTARTQKDKISTYGSGFMPFNYDPTIGLDGINGALQRAINLSGINGGHNYPQEVGNAAEQKMDWVYRVLPEESVQSNGVYSSSYGTAFTLFGGLRWFLDSEHMAGAPAGEQGAYFSHTPGYVTQADVLSMIGSKLVARGDTFKIRSYGEVKDPYSSRVTAHAWLEAIVQRVPEPVSDKDGDWEPDDELGRQFRIVSMRWLNDDEV